MQKIKLILVLYALCTNIAVHASNANTEIKLLCSINLANYDGIQHAAVSKEISLTALKHLKGGAVLVSQTNKHEFWAMIHGQQTLNNLTFINNFQVAIKNKKSGLFMHALSDTNHNPESKPKKARLSLIDYASNSFLEKGELIFECLFIQ